MSDTLLITNINIAPFVHKNSAAAQNAAEKSAREALLMAILSGKHAAEFRVAPLQETTPSLVGNIYIGKVRKIQKNIDSAFIEIADRQQCYYNISANPSPMFTRKGNSRQLAEGDELIVQVQRDGLKTKLPAVSAKLELAGYYLILVTDGGRLGISTKLDTDARTRLREWLSPFAAEQYGWIARTNAGSASKEEIEAEARTLQKEYEALMQAAPHRTCFSVLKKPLPAWLSVLRDVYTTNLDAILTDLPDIHASIQDYLQVHQPEILGKLRLYADDLLPLFKLYNLERELELAMQERVWMKSGGYLVIQPTEALTVIDVNTGKYTEKKARRETLLKINLEAAAESARQIRLRNLSGIILIDFINMENKEDQAKLLQYLDGLLKQDPVKTRLIDMTKLELVEITRRKVQKTLAEQLNANA